MSLTEIIHRGIEQYNRYRYPEAEAKLVKIENDMIVVEFRGPFRFTCGVIDWIEDLRYELEDLGVKVKLVKVEDKGDTLISYFKLESSTQR